MSSLSWLDHSERDRRRALDVVQLFREQSTVDELGLGVIWEPIANVLFPATSTVQTRARYFLFIPWTYLGLERRRVGSSAVAAKARRAEIALVEALIASGEVDGVIGISARRNLKRLPSEVYWRGLALLGIRLFPGSRDQYHRSLDVFFALQRRRPSEEEAAADATAVSANWHPGLPDAPDNFPDDATLNLGAEEAGYLRERFLLHHPDSLLAFLVGSSRSSSVESPWMHPDLASMPERLREILHHARLFSLAMHGAPLLYNLLLARAQRREDLAADYEDRLLGWSDEAVADERDLLAWQRDRFWGLLAELGARVPVRSRQFVEGWLDLALEPGRSARIHGDPVAQRLVEQRERALKGGRARLSNPRALALWGGASGANAIDYRWGNARIIVNDIVDGLERDA